MTQTQFVLYIYSTLDLSSNSDPLFISNKIMKHQKNLRVTK